MAATPTFSSQRDDSQPTFAVAEDVFFAAPVAIGLYRTDGTCILANEAYANVIGAARETILALNFHDIKAWQTTGLLDAALRTLATGEPERLEFAVRTSFGRDLWARCEFARISRGPEPLLFLMFNDLTELKQREQELATAVQTAEENNDAKTRFLASISHELRTPLNAILGFSEMMRSDPIAGNAERVKEYSADIHSSAKWLLSLIDDILDLSRLEQGAYEVELVRFDPAAVIERAVNLCRHSAHVKQLSLEVIYSTATAAIGDVRLFQQALVNLLSNAVKFTDSGGRISISVEHVDDTVCAAVADTGIGIPAAELPRLGQPFAQVRRPGNKLYAGTGLGLAITKAVMERQGGSLLLASTEGVGTTARLVLPAAPAVSL